LTSVTYAHVPRPPAVARFIVVAVAVPAILAALAIWLGGEYHRSDVLRGVARASFTQRITIGELIASLNEAESSQRGFVLTADPTFLAPYEPAKASAGKAIDRLSAGFAKEPGQLARLDQLHSLVDEKFAEMDRVREQRTAGGLGAAVDRVKEGQGKRLMDRIRSVAMDLSANQEQLSNQRSAALATRNTQTRDLVWIIVAAISLLLAIGLWLLWRQQRSRYEAELSAFDAAERNRIILDSTIDAIAILNPSGTIETINAAASTMLGYRPEELERRDVSVLIKLLDRPVTFHERIGLVDGKLANPYLSDRTILHRDGTPIPVDIALGVMRLPDGDHVVASVRDISDRKRIERMKDDLMSTVSHELRTPLTSVVGALGLLRAGSAGKLPDSAARLIEIAENNSRRLIRLINDMLDIDRIQSGRLHLNREVIDLRDVVKQACVGSEGLASANEVRIVCDVPDNAVEVSGDADRLVQVISNLTSNAVRVSPKGGAVTIGVRRTQRDSKALVTVDDEGPGVPAEFRDRIFGRFERAAGEEGVGTGLGLAISREIVSRHDGRIWFEDLPDGGTRFAFLLDTLRVQPQVSRTGCMPVLICEDDPEVAETLRAMVAAIGHDADLVSTAAQARAAIARGGYAALLLDLNLPDENGLSLAHSLRTANGTSTLPIVIVSATDRDGTTGPVPIDLIDWIAKPVDPERLVRAVQIAVARSGVERPLILHLDDDQDMLDITAAALQAEARVVKATDLATARAMLEVESPDVAILDLHLAEGSGLDLLPMLVDKNGLAVPTIIYSAHDVSAEAASRVDAVLVKSRGSLPDLRATIRRIVSDRPSEIS
jgi:PAS domain S-box-containing protein